MNEHLALDAFYLEHPGRRGEWESSVEDDRVWMTGSSVLDQRGQLLRAALGFAGLPRPSYDRSLWALRTWAVSHRRRLSGGGCRAIPMPPYHMPGMNGLEVTQRLKADVATRRVPIVALTSAGADEANKLSQAGCLAFIPKPFDPDEFRRLVAEVLHATVVRGRRIGGPPTAT